MSKHGEKAPTTSDKSNQEDDKWLKWIKLREKQIKSSSKSNSEKDEYLKMLEGLRDHRNKLLDEEAHMNEYEKWLRRNRFRNEAQAWEDQHSQQPGEIHDDVSSTTEPALHPKQEQETWREYRERTMSNEDMATIAEFIPIIRADEKTQQKYKDFISRYLANVEKDKKDNFNKAVMNMRDQTPEEYSHLISKIYEHFPRKSSKGETETQEDYRRRIEGYYKSGDLQFTAAMIMGLPQYEDYNTINNELKKREKKLKEASITSKERKSVEEEMGELKNSAFILTSLGGIYKEYVEAKRDREVHGRDLAVIRDFIPIVEADEDTKEEYHDFVSFGKGLTRKQKEKLHDHIENMKGQTKKDYLDLILGIYRIFSRNTVWESYEDYKDRIEQAYKSGDLQLAAAEIIDPTSKEIASKIRKLERKLAQGNMTPEQQEENREIIRDLKVDALTMARINRDIESRKTRAVFWKDLLLSIKEEKRQASRKTMLQRLGRLANLIAKPNE